jgi:hypothetical protein
MSCCGRRMRTDMRTVVTAARPPAGVLFEYVGRTGLTIIGPGSRTSYRFDGPGARVLVDGRDRPSLAVIPTLRRVGY